LSGKARILLGVHDYDPFRRLDGTGIGISSGTDPGMHPIGDRNEMRFALRFDCH
jgi:hypothetical protein